MNLENLLSPTRILLNIESTSQNDILTQLTKPLLDEGILTNQELFIEELIQREKQITTVIDDKVAFPHARTQTVDRLSLVVGLAKDGQKIALSDDPNIKPVNVFFLIAIPLVAPASHMPLLQHLAKFARYDKKIEKLLKSKTANSALKYLLSFKG